MEVVRTFLGHKDDDVCSLLVKKENDNRSYVKLDILGYSYMGLLDSGANRSVVNAQFADTLSTHGLKPTSMQPIGIATADGVTHSITKVIDVPISFDGQYKIIPIMVMPALTQPLILGKDFFDEFGIELQFKGVRTLSNTEIGSLESSAPVIIGKEDLASAQQEQLRNLIEELKKTIGSGLGRTDMLKHSIDTADSKPIHQRQYNFSPVIKKAIEKELDEMLAMDVVEPSHSSWCSPVLIVKKPNGDNRLCLDSRLLNRVTKRDTYPLPRVSNIIDNLRNARFLSTIDLKSAFWQIPLEEESKQKTAFAIAGRGLFHFKVMPFGLINASQTQQRLMDVLFHAEEDKVWAYLDDIVICSTTFEEHTMLLRKVMLVLKSANLTINVDKCKFARPSLRYLGYIIDKDGLRTDPEKVEAIINFPRPTTFTELKRFIGLASWYRRFVKDFSDVAAPLHDLTKGKKSKKFVWTKEAEVAWLKLKTLLTSTPVMTCPDYTKPFVIQCDASSTGIGAVLCQKTDEIDQPVAYLSRKLNEREAKYSASERELLSVVYAVEKFRPYVDGTRFTVLTDHSALLWLHKMKDPHGRLARWAMKLQQFEFDIIHRPGKCHTVPDALSRGALTPNCEVDIIEILDSHKDSWYKNTVAKVSSEIQNSEWTVSNGLLYKRIPMKEFPNRDDLWKLFVPEALRSKVLQECHDNPTAGHLGIRKTYFRIKQKFYWPKMLRDVKLYVNQCQCCASQKVSQQLPLGQMGHYRDVTEPWQVVAMDFMGPFPKSKSCNTMLLVITCLFSKFTLLFPLRTGKADKLCEVVERQFLVFGPPKVIVCDNGKQFVSNMFKDLATKFNSQIMYTPHYHAQSNPTERVNRVIGTMISSYIKTKKHNEWDSNLDEIGHAIRTAVHEATGYTPSYLFFGRETAVSNLTPTSLPLQITIPTDSHTLNTMNYQANLKERKGIFREVQERLRKAHTKSGKHYNQRTRPGTFQVGDTVWKRTKYLSNANNKFMAKLAPKFEKAIIVDKLSDIVFRLNNVYGKNIGVWHIKDLKPYSLKNK